MKTVHFLPVILLSAGLIFFYSCSDNTVTGYKSGIINGTVQDMYGTPVYPARVWLDHGTPRNVYPDGTFSFENVVKPYDLTIQSQQSNQYVKFNGLTVDDPKLTFYLTSAYNYPSRALIYLTFPKLPQGHLIKFTFLNSVERYIFSTAHTTDSSMEVTLRWNGTSRLRGKAALIRYTRDYLGNIVSYNRFGYKDTAVSPGETILMNMTEAEMSYDPPENVLAVHMPAGVSSSSMDLGIKFDGYPANSGISFMVISGNPIPLTYIVPGALNLNYQVYTNISYGHNSYYTLAGHGGNVYVPSEPPVNLLQPANDDSADYNTEFKFSGDGHVYVTAFYASNQYGTCNFYVVSESNSIRMPILPFYGFNFPKGTRFSWFVIRYNDFANMSEFVSDKRISLSGWNTTASGGRDFYLK